MEENEPDNMESTDSNEIVLKQEGSLSQAGTNREFLIH